ncbi:MAG: response regulator transcription factor [Dehalococcoidia bacterium]
MTRTRVMLVDDHEIVRFGLRSLIDSEPDMHVVGEAIDGPSAIRQAEALRPQVIVMDIRMGPLDGIEACRAIRERMPEAAVLMFTSFGTDEAVMGALVAGASGFLVKNTGRDDLLRAIRALAEGHSLLDPAVTRRVTEQLVALASKSEPEEIAGLSPREREVLLRIAEGDTNRQIAERLVISEATARNHVSHVLEKLGLSRRSEAAALAARLRLGEQRD